MNTTNRTVGTIEEALMQAQPHELLAAFVTSFNDLTGQLDELSQERDELSIQTAAQHTQILDLQARIADLEKENDLCRSAALEAERIAHNIIALKGEKTRLQDQLAQLQKVIASYGGVNGIDKLKEQNKRLKSGNADKDARIGQLERENGQYRHDLTATQRQTIEAHTKIDELQRQLAHDTGSGLYHNGEHHLIIWPQKNQAAARGWQHLRGSLAALYAPVRPCRAVLLQRAGWHRAGPVTKRRPETERGHPGVRP